MPSSPYTVETRWDGTEQSPTGERIAEIVAELDVSDEEHPDAWLTHTESGWTIRLDEERCAYLEDPELKTISHMQGVSGPQACELWLRFATGGPDAVRGHSWAAGPRVYTPAETTAMRERSRVLTLESDRQFFESLGSGQPERQCKRSGCNLGAIKHSVLCASHHFEQVRGKPYPLSPQTPSDA